MASFLGFFDTFTLKETAEAFRPYSLSPVPNPAAASRKLPLKTRLTGLRTVPNLGRLTTFLAADTDHAIVGRTWGLLSQARGARAQEAYGPNFYFTEHMRTRNWLSGVLVHWGLALGGFLLVALPPLRSVVRWFVYKQGDGPDREESKKHEIEFRGVATPDTDRSVGKQAFCRASYFGSMYACECGAPFSCSR